MSYLYNEKIEKLQWKIENLKNQEKMRILRNNIEKVIDFKEFIRNPKEHLINHNVTEYCYSNWILRLIDIDE